VINAIDVTALPPHQCSALLARTNALLADDLFAERLGFKLVWGCLCFYPHFYCVGVWPLLDVTPDSDLSRGAAAAVAALFGGGWVLTRGANLQKFLLKSQGGQPAAAMPWPAMWLVGWVEVRTVEGSAGRLLCSGWWGLARHINYCVSARARARASERPSIDRPQSPMHDQTMIAPTPPTVKF
jgi:hypothetical protein